MLLHTKIQVAVFWMADTNSTAGLSLVSGGCNCVHHLHIPGGFLNRGSPTPVLAVEAFPPTHFCAASAVVVTIAVVCASLICG